MEVGKEAMELMINAVRAHVPAPCSKEKATLAVLGVLSVVERERVPHTWKELKEKGSSCNAPHCRLSEEEHE